MINFNKIFSILFLLLLSLLYVPKVNAQVATQSGITNIKVTVSGNVLIFSGYIAPYASVVLTINGTIVTSTVADGSGNFSFTNIGVPKDTSTICLDAVDFKKLGTSQACVDVTVVNGTITKTGVFLPPTLGVQRVDVTVGDSAILFGYGMPGSNVTVHLNGGQGCSVLADDTGYYTCSIVIEKQGQNELFADATLRGKQSEKQLKKILIQGIALTKITPIPTSVVTTIAHQLPSLNLFQIPWWIWLLLVLIAIILVIILTRKYWLRTLPGIPATGIPAAKVNHVFDFLFKSRKLHHHWMRGVGY